MPAGMERARAGAAGPLWGIPLGPPVSVDRSELRAKIPPVHQRLTGRRQEACPLATVAQQTVVTPEVNPGRLYRLSLWRKVSA